MYWLQALDLAIFHWVNSTLRNPFFDVFMPFCSGNVFFVPVVVTACAALLWRGGARGRLCVLMLVLALALGDTLICNTMKQLVGRQRPFWVLADAHLSPGIGRTSSGSMPSSHAANWFAAAMVLCVYYRRSVWFMVPLACLVSFSRIYNGVHYPSDVLAGAILGSGYAAGGVWTLDALWYWAGPRWFPLWWQRLPSLMNPAATQASLPSLAGDAPDLARMRDAQLIHLGYALVFLLLAVNLVYIGSGKIELSEDEAYQWVWSKHLALSYYSKPPLIAYTQFLGTTLWGDNGFGVRFFSPVISALGSICLLRFLARNANARAALCVCVMSMASPLVAVGSVLMTIDPLNVLFWTLAMIAGWRAVRQESTLGDWLWVGVWMGLGFLSKYTELFQLSCWVVFFSLYAPARAQLRRPGPYLALLLNLLFATPVLIWNAQHHWITVEHVASNGGLQNHWSPTLGNIWYGLSRYTLETFLGLESLILNPFFWIPTIWAAIVFWRRKPRNPLLLYLFSMSAPVVLVYLLLSFRSRIFLNWIAPSVLPLFCLGAVYWEEQWRAGVRWVKKSLVAGLIFGGFLVVLLHDNDLIPKLTGHALPANLNPMSRVLGWKETAQTVEEARERMLAEGKPVFIIGGHYGITGEITFYLPEARLAAAGRPLFYDHRDMPGEWVTFRVEAKHPLVYYQTETAPANQFYYWPGYQDRKSQNAIYVQELNLIPDRKYPGADMPGLPPLLLSEFESVKDLGAVIVKYNGQPIRRIRLAECRGLR
jgi:4-amino-4-deoxy-L-arabinose transferase-like glycosyltransferase/membrane-associated phospholipid phosphatase